MLSIDEAIAREKANAEKLRKNIETGYDGEISIKALFCDDTDAIKEVYERFENCAKEYEQLAEWLELLKWYEQGMEDIPSESGVLPKDVYHAGYNKAIDDFVEELKDYFVIPHDVRVIEMKAEQLKAGKENNKKRTV